MNCVYWNQEEFYDSLTKAFVMLYEKNMYSFGRLIYEPFRVTREEINVIKKRGLFFPARDRVILAAPILDLKNDGHLTVGGVTFAYHDNNGNNDTGDHVIQHYGFKQLSKLPSNVRYFNGTVNKKLYQTIVLYLTKEWELYGLKTFQIVDKNGNIDEPRVMHPLLGKWVLQSDFLRNNIDDVNYTSDGEGRSDDRRLSLVAPYTMVADRRHTWLVTTEDTDGMVNFGVYEDEVKSLFYSRDIPITEKGRKKPILHWVKAHTRRLANGTEINIKEHLRGINEFTMGDMCFKITQPQKKDDRRLIKEYEVELRQNVELMTI